MHSVKAHTITVVSAIVTIFAFLFFADQKLYASGAKDGGGGDVIVCRYNKYHVTHQVADYFLDHRQALPDAFVKYQILRLGSAPEDYFEQIMLSYLDRAAPEEAKKLRSVSLNYVYEPGELPDLSDDGIVLSRKQANKGCEKHQLAIQDLENGIVRVSAHHYQNLSLLQKGVLRIHERYINLLKIPGQTTHEIRRATMSLFSQPGFNQAVINEMAQGYKDDVLTLQISAALWETSWINARLKHINEQFLRFGFKPFEYKKLTAYLRDPVGTCYEKTRDWDRLNKQSDTPMKQALIEDYFASCLAHVLRTELNY